MDRYGLRDLVAPFYSKRGGDSRLDHAERVEAIVTRWQKEQQEDLDEEVLIATAYLYAISEDILPHHATRVGVEAWFVEQGWGNARIRGLMRSIERLPDSPKSMEEKLVADADTVCRLGLLGLSRAMIVGGQRGESLPEVLLRVQQDLYRRAYTAPGQREIVPLKSRLRDLAEELRGQTGDRR
ncbi:MAG: hypothetical protein AAFX94_15625 [Myxococcota bacterium]